MVAATVWSLDHPRCLRTRILGWGTCSRTTPAAPEFASACRSE
jgi:hypothetical protein